MNLILSLLLSIPVPPSYTVTTTLSDDQRINAVIHNDKICTPTFYNTPPGGPKNIYHFMVGGCEVELGSPSGPTYYFLRNSIVVDRPGVWFNIHPGTTVSIKRGTVPALLIRALTYIDGHNSYWIAAANPYDLPLGTNVVPLIFATATFRFKDLALDAATGDCLFLSADAPHYGTIGDQWRLYDSAFFNCGGSGLWVEGGDSNTGIAEGNLADHACAAADDVHSPRPKVDPVTKQPRCAGFADDSFLGNTYLGNQSQLSGYGFISVQASARNMYLNNYSEGDEKCAYINAPSTWIGGICGQPEGSSNSWVDGVLKSRYTNPGPWYTPHLILAAIPTSTSAYQLGTVVELLQPYGTLGNYVTFKLLPYPGSHARWTPIDKVEAVGK